MAIAAPWTPIASAIGGADQRTDRLADEQQPLQHTEDPGRERRQA